MPGYTTKDGQVAHEWNTQWRPLVGAYLSRFAPPRPGHTMPSTGDVTAAASAAPEQPALRAALFLCDIRWETTAEDAAMLAYLWEELQLHEKYAYLSTAVAAESKSPLSKNYIHKIEVQL